MRRVPAGVWVFVGLLVAGLLLHLATAPGGAAHGHAGAAAPSRVAKPRYQGHTSPRTPAPPRTPATAAQAVAAAGGPSGATVETVAAPGEPGVVWGLVPTPASGRWWFGVATHGVWRWAGVTPTTPLPTWWPLAPRRVLADASALAAGTLSSAPPVGLAPWNTVTGHVTMPVCWSLTAASGAVVLAAMLPSRAYPALAYQLSTTWTPTNRVSGADNLNGLVPVTGGRAAWCGGS